MINVGRVLYQRGEEPGSLIAKWYHPYFGEGVLMMHHRNHLRHNSSDSLD